MLPPTDVYSAVIANESGESVTVVVDYTIPEKPNEKLELVIPPNGTAKAPQKSVTIGSASFTGVIVSISIKGTAVASEAPFPGVNSPVKDYKVRITHSGGKFALKF
ncbi:hypothetical protein ADEAN_000547900 [Angomonas deanei]|uniref:Uncharacterized protein n=1 Tax=Angomonas deanei TaxID=59799 RepID=A0A7G2CH21_9TRYP|nr:hypothetical protein ADEAN_000547900 [Angomonas deanei]